MKRTTKFGVSAFTLIELSIVLVIIGLIVGGVLVGRDLISAAAVRSQISQIASYTQAVNTFKGKYNFLPGDIPNPDAVNFGFVSRGSNAGQGDGNYLLEARGASSANSVVQSGEFLMFWVDLSTARMIDGGFSSATPSAAYTTYTSSATGIGRYYPAAKIGQENYVNITSKGVFYASSAPQYETSNNYFTLAKIKSITAGTMLATEGLTVRQAYNIDKKLDDGVPMAGNVMAYFNNGYFIAWAGPSDMSQNDPGNFLPLPYTGAIWADSGTCFDNTTATSGTTGVAGELQHYSLGVNNGNGMNCALSFKFQ